MAYISDSLPYYPHAEETGLSGFPASSVPSHLTSAQADESLGGLDQGIDTPKITVGAYTHKAILRGIRPNRKGLSGCYIGLHCRVTWQNHALQISHGPRNA